MDEKKNVRVVVEEVGGETPVEVKDEVKEETTPQEETPEVKENATKETLNKETQDIKETNKVEVKGKSSFNVFWVLIPGMLLLGLLIGGIFAYVFGIQKISDIDSQTTDQTQNQTIKPSQTSTPSPSASPSADLTKYNIKILNGSGISGEAGKVQTLLENAGFIVLSTGNASAYDYEETEITIKTGIDPDFVIALEDALKENYQIKDTKTLSSQTNDITVTVGSLKAE